jgi:hypothetical protein
MTKTLEDLSGDNIIDSRDLYRRKCELESLRDDAENATNDYEEAQSELGGSDEPITDAEERRLGELCEAMKEAQDAFGEPEKEELKELERLENEIDDFMHGATLVHENYFKKYAEQYADDIGAIDRNAKWPVNCIDWDEAAEQLRSDFSEVAIDGAAYYFS